VSAAYVDGKLVGWKIEWTEYDWQISRGMPTTTALCVNDDVALKTGIAELRVMYGLFQYGYAINGLPLDQSTIWLVANTYVPCTLDQVGWCEASLQILEEWSSTDS